MIDRFFVVELTLVDYLKFC